MTIWNAAATIGVTAATLFASACASKPRPPRPVPDATSRPSLRDTTHPASRPAFGVSDMRVQTLPAQAYFFVRTRTTFGEIRGAIDGAMSDLSAAAEGGRVAFTGPATFVYLGATPELNRPFTLEVGFPVAEGTRPFGRFQVRTLPALRAATVVYTGPVSFIDKGYDRLIPAMEAAGLQPADESREVYQTFQGPESERNETLIAVGIR